MTDLSINLNKIALIRNSRITEYPSVVRHAQMCIAAGADGITVHPRPDQRHIRAQDCYDLHDKINVELNIEGNPFAGPMKSERADVSDYPGFMALVRDIKPAQCTLVPDSNEQLTSDHGFDLRQDTTELASIIVELKALGVRVSLFMDADPSQMSLAKKLGADRVELYTESYADAVLCGEDITDQLEKFRDTALAAQQEGLGVNAGHDLNLNNLAAFTQTVPELLEVSIGHAFTVDSIELGLAKAVAEYQRCLGKNP
ncbi:MAG: pyridoxine 5'-phosphate synthase [Pseudomonadales bacterium]